MKRLLMEREHMFFTKPTKCIYVYSNYQDAYDEMQQIGLDITFMRNIPTEKELINLTNNQDHTIMIIDDKLLEILQSPFMVQVFTRLSHHMKMSTFLILQASNLSSGKYGTEIMRNAHYSILFKAGQMAYLIRSLGVRLNDYPNLMASYKAATAGVNYSYLVVNSHPKGGEMEKYSTNVLPSEGPTILFLSKEQ